MTNLEEDLVGAVEKGLSNGYERSPVEHIANAVRGIRTTSLHSDATLHLLRAKEQELTATGEELGRRAEELLNEHKDCTNALNAVRRLMQELST